MMDDYNDYEDEEFDFDFDVTGYRFEPEYTDTELQEMDDKRAREEREAEVAQVMLSEVAAEARPRISGDFWCSCKRCKQMPREEESLCCREWDLLLPNAIENLDVSVDDTGSSPLITITL
jgi:hypothetical protein